MRLVIQNSGHVWGGNEKWLGILAAGLGSRGHDVLVSCKAGPVRDRLQSRGIRTTKHRPRGAVDPVSASTFAWLLARESPHALLLTSWQPIMWGLLAARVAGVPRTVLRQGIVRPFPSRGPRAMAMRRMSFAIIANSREIRDVWLRTAPWFPADKVNVVMNAVESRIDRRPELRRRLREELGAGPDELVVGGAGHVTPRKGFDYLLRAFAATRLTRSRVVIIGDGPNLPELRELAASLGIADRVSWLGHRDDAPDLLAGLDLFVLSSHNEGMANVMLEAMAGGTPVIASDVSGVRKAVGDSDGRPAAGWIVPPADVAALARALSDAASVIRGDGSVAQKLVREADWRIRNWFSVDRMIIECEAILFGDG